MSQLIFHQKETKYKSIPAKIDSFNKTVDVSTLNPNDSTIVYNNGTHNYTTITKVIYPASETVPAGQQIGAEGGMNVLGLVVFSIVFGIVLGRMGEKGTPLKAFFETLNEVVMKMVSLVMWYVKHSRILLFLSSSSLAFRSKAITSVRFPISQQNNKLNKLVPRIVTILKWRGLPLSGPVGITDDGLDGDGKGNVTNKRLMSNTIALHVCYIF